MGGAENFLDLVVEKLKELWLAMEDFWAQFFGWFDKVFPLETRPEKIHHWLHIAFPFLIGFVLISLLYCCCKYCFCSGGGRRGGGGSKWMKAPGRNCRMRRHVFEADPKGYYKNLRAYPGDELC